MIETLILGVLGSLGASIIFEYYKNKRAKDKQSEQEMKTSSKSALKKELELEHIAGNKKEEV